MSGYIAIPTWMFDGIQTTLNRGMAGDPPVINRVGAYKWTEEIYKSNKPIMGCTAIYGTDAVNLIFIHISKSGDIYSLMFVHGNRFDQYINITVRPNDRVEFSF